MIAYSKCFTVAWVLYKINQFGELKTKIGIKGRTLRWLTELKNILNHQVSGKTGTRAAVGNPAVAPF